MPHEVEHKIRAEYLKPGDKLTWRSRQWTVEKTDIKTKYVNLKVEGSLDVFRIERAQQVTVNRTEPTPQEAYDKRHAAVAQAILRNLREAEGVMEEAKQAFAEKVQGKYMVGYWEITTFLTRQTVFDCWAKVLQRLRAADGGQDLTWDEILMRADDPDLIDTMRSTVARVRDDVWRRGETGGNLVTHAIYDLDYEVKRKWVDGWGDTLAVLDHLKPAE